MSDYVIMPKADYQAACDALRDAVGTTSSIVSGNLVDYISSISNKVGKVAFKSYPMLSSGWASVTYGDGKFVAVSYNIKIAYSTDGINWNESTSVPLINYSSVTYGDGKFVAVGTNTTMIAYSTDGINWNQTSCGKSSDWNAVTYGDGKFVAVGYDDYRGTIAYSTDGINWTCPDCSSFFSYKKLFSVVYGAGKFVVGTSHGMYYSIDVASWTKSNSSIGGQGYSVTYGNDKFVVASKNTTPYYSTDGISWSASIYVYANIWEFVTYGGGKFIAISNSSQNAIYSTDGITWGKCKLNGQYHTSAVYGDGKFVVVTNNTPNVCCCDFTSAGIL